MTTAQERFKLPELTYMGYKVMIVPPRPRMQLSDDCPVTPEFRKEMNQWMADFFGEHPDMLISEKLSIVWMTETQYRRLRAHSNCLFNRP